MQGVVLMIRLKGGVERKKIVYSSLGEHVEVLHAVLKIKPKGKEMKNVGHI